MNKAGNTGWLLIRNGLAGGALAVFGLGLLTYGALTRRGFGPSPDYPIGLQRGEVRFFVSTGEATGLVFLLALSVLLIVAAALVQHRRGL